MAKQRDPAQPLAPPPRLQPRATPVDTFHRPDVELLPQGDSEMKQLAEALGQFQPTLQNIGVNAQLRSDKRARDEGEKEALANKRLQTIKGLGDAVRNGEIPAARNPAFLEGMRNQVYRIEAMRYDTGLREAYAKSDARNTEDITSFMSGHTSKYLELLGADQSDPGVANILLPAIERSQATLAANHRAERDQAIEFQAETNTDTEIGLLLDNLDETGGDPKDYAASISAIVQGHYQNGLSGTRGNLIMAKAIARKAKERKDTGYLDLMDMIPGGAGGTLGQIGSAKDIRREAEEYIHSKIEEDDRVAAHQAKVVKEATVDKGLSEGFGRLLADPAANVDDVMLTLNDADPKAAQTLYGWKQAMINGADNIVEDAETVSNLTYKVMSGNSSIQEVGEAQAAGLISKETARGLAKELPRAADFRSILRDPTMAEGHKRLGQIIQKSDSNATEVDLELARRAQTDYLRILGNWKAKHPDASEREIIDEAAATQDSLIRMYSPDVAKGADENTEMTLDVALVSDPQTVDWSRKPLFDSREDLIEAAKQYNTDKTGPLAELAAHVDKPVMDVYKAQLNAAIRKEHAKAKTAQPKK